MPEATTILPEPVGPGAEVQLHVPGLRYGEIVENTAAVTINNVPQPEVGFAVDLLKELVHVRNGGASPWAQGATLLVVWSGSLASGPPSGEGGGADVGLTERVDVLETKVETHEWQLQGHEQRISFNHAALVDINGRVVTLEGQVDPALAGRVVTLEGEVAGLKDEDSSHNETLTDHETRLDTLEAAPPPSGGEGTGGVPASGGTFTGPVVFKGSDADSFAMVIDTANAADGCSIQGRSAGIAKWEVSLGGPGVDADFAISRYPMWEDEFPQDSPLVIYRATGFIKLIITERADSAAAGAAGVPIGGLYHTNGTVKIRTY